MNFWPVLRLRVRGALLILILVVSMIGPASGQSGTPLHYYVYSGNGDFFYSTDYNELGGGGSGWNYLGEAANVESSEESGTVPFYRYYNSTYGDHFYTTNYGELGGGGSGGWVYEGVCCYVYSSQETGTVPFYRFWNPFTTRHFYTTDYEAGDQYPWEFEGVEGYVFPS